MEKLLSLGAKAVPIIAKGDHFVHAIDLKKVADFVGITTKNDDKLTPEELVSKLKIINQAAERYFNQIPTNLLEETAVSNRKRPLKQLGFHIFNLSEIFLDTCSGEELKFEYFENPIPTSMKTSIQIAEYGKRINERVCDWWGQQDEKSLQQHVSTYYGQQTVSEVLERTTWHVAQHVRQVLFFMEKKGIKPDGPLTAENLKGLPIPDSVSDK